jgi:inosose dehydratase
MKRRDLLAGALGATVVPAALRALAPSRPEGIRFGYAAITWGGNDLQAIEDVAALGFRGIQLRGSAVTEWGTRPQELKDLLASRNLTLVALSSGLMRIDPAFEAEDLATHVKHAQFVRDVGGLY